MVIISGAAPLQTARSLLALIWLVGSINRNQIKFCCRPEEYSSLPPTEPIEEFQRKASIYSIQTVPE